jgi:osmotically inducible lipoprotein OsmB
MGGGPPTRLGWLRSPMQRARRTGRIGPATLEGDVMKTVKLLGLLACAVALSGCLDTDTERGLAGAAGGAVIADVTGGNAVTGAVVGGAAGVFCDDLGVCK